MMSSNVVLLHSNNCCVVLEPVICEDLDLHVAIFIIKRIEKYPGWETVAGLVIVVRVGALLEEEENVGAWDLQHRVEFSVQSSV